LIPGGVTGIFHLHIPSSRSMALKLTQPLTVYFRGCKDGQCVELALPLSCADFLEIWETHPPETMIAYSGPLQGMLYLSVIKFFQNTVAAEAANNVNFVVCIL
jgi:hypothetical protein